MAKAKRKSTKVTDECIWSGGNVVVNRGHLTTPIGRPGKIKRLFLAVGEKLPFETLKRVKKGLEEQGIKCSGVYIAHDSMGAPRYVGRGAIFTRLASHLKAHPDELRYFSFFVVEDKSHEREVETLLIRGASHMLEFNDRKKRVGILPGSVSDFEPGTTFFERQKKRGRRSAKKS